MTEQELLDEGYGLWYIVLEHTNHRFVDTSYDPFIYDDIDAAKQKADGVSKIDFGKYVPIMVKDYNLKYKKHMDTRPKTFAHAMDGTLSLRPQSRWTP